MRREHRVKGKRKIKTENTVSGKVKTGRDVGGGGQGR